MLYKTIKILTYSCYIGYDIYDNEMAIGLFEHMLL